MGGRDAGSPTRTPDDEHRREAPPLGLGLIGCGAFGVFLVDSLADLRGARWVAVTDVDSARAEAAAARSNAAVSPNVTDLLARHDVDLVVVATPPATHGRLARTAAEAGKHVFCEKPLAIDVAEAMQAVAAAEASGVALAVDYVMRWNPLYWLVRRLQALRTDAASPLLGPLRHFAFENFAADERLPEGHWFWDPSLSGGIFVEHGVHFFDAAAWLIGSDPEVVAGLQAERIPGLVDTVIATALHGRGATATYHHSFTHADAVEYQTVLLDWGFARAVVHGWIPVELEMEAWTDEAGAALIEQAVADPAAALDVPGVRRSGAERIDLELSGIASATSTWRGRGEERPVTRHVRIAASLGGEAAKGQVYRECVRAGLTDLLAAAREGRRPLVDGRAASASLATALAAQSAADSGCSVRPGYRQED